MLRSILLLAAATTASSSAKPNVLVLFADDMGHADLGVYGAPTTSTPNLDKLANEGVRFTAWYSGFHICSPSRAAMMTGRLCVRSGTCGAGWLGGVFGNAPVAGLPTNETTFATALSTAGYATAAMGKWHLGTKDEYMPTSHGFDQYFGIPYSVRRANEKCDSSSTRPRVKSVVDISS
jgi:arylsulfatase A